MSNKQPWDQLDNESTEAYARFLVYRNLGPARTIEHAYQSTAGNKSGKRVSRSGYWEKDSADYSWRERAARWDVAQLSQVVPETAGIIFQAIKEFAVITLREVTNYKPRNWAEVKDSIVILSNLVAPEVIAAAVDQSINAEDGNAPDQK